MKKLLLSCLTTTATLAFAASHLHAAPIVEGQAYLLSDLGALPGKKESVPTAIDNAGSVVGISSAGPATEDAFRYSAKTGLLNVITSKPASSLTRAFGTNDAGVVVGDSTFGATIAEGTEPFRQAAVFMGNSAAALDSVSAAKHSSRANDINNLHMIVGSSSADDSGQKSRAFAWTKSAGMFDLQTLGGDFTTAVAINDAGFVAGTSEVRRGKAVNSQPKHAFLLQLFESGKTAQMIDLGTLGGTHSYATALSEKNHVVGYSNVNTTDGSFHAFLYEEGKMQDLGSLSQDHVKTDQSFALGVNRSGTVVGYAFLPLEKAARQVGFVFSGGKMRDLNEMIGRSAKRYLIYSAEAINDQGQIAATAFDQQENAFRAVLLTPAENSRLE